METRTVAAALLLFASVVSGSPSPGAEATIALETYKRCEVFTLPEEVGVEPGPILDALLPFEYLNSELLETQIAAWLVRASAAELQQIRKEFPPPWQASQYSDGGTRLRLEEKLAAAIAFRLGADSGSAPRYQAGRLAGATGFYTTLAKVLAGPESERNGLFLSGMAAATATLPNFEAANAARVFLDTLPRGVQGTYSGVQRRTPPWPLRAFDQSSLTLHSGFAAELEYYCASAGEATSFSSTPLWNARGLFTERVTAAREPAVFWEYWKALEPDQKSRSLARAASNLFRVDYSTTVAILKSYHPDSWSDAVEIASVWAVFDPEAAISWLDACKPGSEVFDATLPLRPLRPSTAIAVYRSHPALLSKNIGRGYLTAGFSPTKDNPIEVMTGLLALPRSEQTGIEVNHFISRWANFDAPAALAFARGIEDRAQRSACLSTVANTWFDRDFDGAVQALKSVPEAEQIVVWKLAHRNAPTHFLQNEPKWEPARRYTTHIREIVPHQSSIGDSDQVDLAALRRRLAGNLFPGGLQVQNSEACAELLALPDGVAISLALSFEKDPPANARENLLRRLALERWALANPKSAAEWMLNRGDGYCREALPLALSRLAISDPEEALKMTDRIPVSARFWYANSDNTTAMQYANARCAVLTTVAAADHGRACDLASPRDKRVLYQIHSDWWRADPNAAKAWGERRWLVIRPWID